MVSRVLAIGHWFLSPGGSSTPGFPLRGGGAQPGGVWPRAPPRRGGCTQPGGLGAWRPRTDGVWFPTGCRKRSCLQLRSRATPPPRGGYARRGGIGFTTAVSVLPVSGFRSGAPCAIAALSARRARVSRGLRARPSSRRAIWQLFAPAPESGPGASRANRAIFPEGSELRVMRCRAKPRAARSVGGTLRGGPSECFA